MSYAIPTATAFKARHTAFALVADGTVDILIAEAARSVSQCWSEGDYTDGIMYLAAHMIAEEQSAGGSTAASKAGPIRRVKADTVEIEYAGSFLSTLTDAELVSTVYGRRFLALRRRNSPGVLVV